MVRPVKGCRKAVFGREGKTTLHATAQPTKRDLYWAAGFLEGEASFDKSSGTTRVSVPQVNHEPIAKLLAMFGGSAKLYTYKSQPNSQSNPFWDWRVYGARARGVMMTLYTLMSAKRKEQIRHALS